MTSTSNGKAPLTPERISSLTGLTVAEVQDLERLGVLSRDPGGNLSDDAVERVTLVRHALSRGIEADRIGALCREQPDLIDTLLANRTTTGSTYTLDEALSTLADDLPDQAFLYGMLDLVGPEPGEPVTDDDIAAIRMTTHALRTGFPGDALLQLIRVMTEALDRVAEAENRVFHDYVHERNRAQGLSGRELFDATDSVSKPLLAMAEPALVYLHRRALHRAMRDDFVRHLTEDTRAPVERPGEMTATMLFIDLAGFTPLTLTMGDRAAADVLSRFASIVRGTAMRRHGRIIKQIGDAFMLAFDDPNDAVSFGIDVCAALADESHFPPVHIGAHHGTVLYRDGDYVGTTVNLAARVAGATESGQFLVTSPIADAARQQASIEFTPLPPAMLKGMDTSTELFEVATQSHRGAARDPVCGMMVKHGDEAARLTHDGTTYLFCSQHCHDKFAGDFSQT